MLLMPLPKEFLKNTSNYLSLNKISAAIRKNKPAHVYIVIISPKSFVFTILIIALIKAKVVPAISKDGANLNP